MNELALLVLLAASSLVLNESSWEPCLPVKRIKEDMTRRHGPPLIDTPYRLVYQQRDGLIASYTRDPKKGICGVQLTYVER